VAINLALRLAELMPGRVALFDLDLVFDDAALLLDVSPGRSLGSIPERDLQHLDARMLNACLAEHTSGLRVLVGATHPEDGERVSGAHARAALTALKRQFPVTIVDCGSNFGEPVLVACELANRVIMLCTPELSTLRDVRDCERVFGQALHLDRKRLSYVFNHPLPVSGLTRVQFETALERPVVFDIPHAGEASARAAAAAGGVVRPTGRSPFAHTLERLVRDLQPPDSASKDGLGPVASVGAPRASLLTRVLGRRPLVHG
jgi:pilus assembly protein CpaE